jgi:predicted lipid-binding transport protein (Tim44 family)
MKPLILLATLLAFPAMAAEPAVKPRPADDLQPAVNTSPSTPAPASAAAPAGSAVPPAPAASQAAPAAPAAGKAAANAPRTGAKDRIELDTTQITGNRELPRVLYVVPWKRSDLGDLAGRPTNSLLDEVLAPVDRDVFKRQNHYYEALKPDAAPGRTAGGSEGEK